MGAKVRNLCQLRISNTPWCCPQTKEQAGYRQDCHAFFVWWCSYNSHFFFFLFSHPPVRLGPERLKTDRMEGSEIYVIILWSFTAVLEILLLTAVGKSQCLQLMDIFQRCCRNKPSKTLTLNIIKRGKTKEEDLLTVIPFKQSGVAAAKLGIVGKEGRLGLSKISFNVLLPCNGFIKIATGVTAGGLKIFW